MPSAPVFRLRGSYAPFRAPSQTPGSAASSPDACPTTHGTITALSESLSCGDSGDSEIVVVTDAEEIIASDRATVDEYIRNWGPLDIYLRLRSEVG